MRTLSPALIAALHRHRLQQAGSRRHPSQRRPQPPKRVSPPTARARIAIAPDGVHVQYRVYGSGEPALVFIHGWSCDSNYWREQVARVQQKYTLVTVDLAGHGGTDGNRTDWTMAQFGQDVATALSAVPNKQIILVGHSMGGPVAIEAARLLKGRVIGIIGVDTFKSIGAPAPSKAQVDALVKPFEADFIGQTRTLVTEHLFVQRREPAARAEDRLRHVAVAAARRRGRHCAPCSNTTSPSRSRTSRCPSSRSIRISASR